MHFFLSCACVTNPHQIKPKTFRLKQNKKQTNTPNHLQSKCDEYCDWCTLRMNLKNQTQKYTQLYTKHQSKISYWEQLINMQKTN